MLKTVAVTGYKPHELGIFNRKHEGITYIQKAFERKLIPLIDDGLEWVIISGQLGVELWVGELILQWKKTRFPHLKLAVLTPFLQQEEQWKEETKRYYQEIVNQADFIDSITKRPYENPNQLKLKNQFILSKVDGLIALYDEEKEGTPIYYINEANIQKKERNFELLLITPDDINMIVEDEYYQE
ncbi:hypothetical protein BTS2_3554 [Bacillus sp. TS-2]|nr:hypothetical protein BTS2_3554 [Bacillus sp. TS-2]